MEITTVQAIIAAVGLLGMGSLGGFILAWRRLPFERRAAKADFEGKGATAARDLSAAWQPLVDQLQEEIGRLRAQLDGQAQRLECLEERDAQAAIRVSELTRKLEAAEERITELERRNKLLEEENAQLRKWKGVSYKHSSLSS